MELIAKHQAGRGLQDDPCALARNLFAKEDGLHRAGSGKDWFDGDRLFLFHNRSGCNRRQRGAPDTTVTKHLAVLTFCGSINDGLGVELVDGLVGRQHPDAEDGPLLVPRLPLDRNGSPILSTGGVEHLVHEVAALNVVAIGIEGNRPLVLEDDGLGIVRAGGGAALR